MPEIYHRTINDVARLIGYREISTVEVCQAMRDRIDLLDSRLHDCMTVTADLTLRQARSAKAEIAAGKYRGPMHSIRFAAKDLIYADEVKGYR